MSNENGAAVADPPPTNPQALAKTNESGSTKVAVRMGLSPANIDEAWRLANVMATSTMVPKNFRNQPADILVAIEMGMELGLAPMQAMQSIAVINGRPSVWGDGFLALIMASPVYQDHDEYYLVGGERRDGLTTDDLKKDDTTAVCTFWRRGKPKPVTRRFSIGQAKRSNLLTKEGPWQQYPDRQLAMRARGFAGRDAFPDVLRGLLSGEEALDTPIIDSVAIPAEPERKQPRRLSETATAAPAAEQTAALAVDAAPEPAAAATTAAPAAAVELDDEPEHQGDRIVALEEKVTNGGRPFTVITTAKGLVCWTQDESMAKAAAVFREHNTPLDLATEKVERSPVPKLVEMQPLG